MNLQKKWWAAENIFAGAGNVLRYVLTRRILSLRSDSKASSRSFSPKAEKETCWYGNTNCGCKEKLGFNSPEYFQILTRQQEWQKFFSETGSNNKVLH